MRIGLSADAEPSVASSEIVAVAIVESGGIGEPVTLSCSRTSSVQLDVRGASPRGGTRRIATQAGLGARSARGGCRRDCVTRWDFEEPARGGVHLNGTAHRIHGAMRPPCGSSELGPTPIPGRDITGLAGCAQCVRSRALVQTERGLRPDAEPPRASVHGNDLACARPVPLPGVAECL